MLHAHNDLEPTTHFHTSVFLDCHFLNLMFTLARNNSISADNYNDILLPHVHISIILFQCVSPLTTTAYLDITSTWHFRCIFVNEKYFILIQIPLKCVRSGPLENNPALFSIMAWHRISDKPLSEPMLTRFIDAYMRHLGGDEVIGESWNTCVISGIIWTHYVNSWLIKAQITGHLSTFRVKGLR